VATDELLIGMDVAVAGAAHEFVIVQVVHGSALRECESTPPDPSVPDRSRSHIQREPHARQRCMSSRRWAG
jgi:hypothetical protein